MKEKPTIVANRMRELREGIKLSQAKLAALLENIEQPAIFRYESGQSFPPYGVLMQYADFFDISLDYLFGRTDNPQGKLYDFQPKVWQDDEQIQAFVEMCFDPASPANTKLKETLLLMLKEQQNNG